MKNEMVIATVWIENSPWGIELEEDEELSTGGYPWMSTGNFALCMNMDALEDFIETQDKDIKELHAYNGLKSFLHWIQE